MKTFRYLLVCLLCLGVWIVPATLIAAPQQPSHQSGKVQPRPVNINSASSEELQVIPGIGVTLAERIIAYRTENGPFKNTEALTSVRGIGEKSLTKLRSWVTLK